MKLLFAAALAVALTGCATGRVVQYAGEKADGPKVVAIDAPRTPWVVEIEKRLREQGFKTLRWASQQRVREKQSETREVEYNESSARYVLVIEGVAPMNKMNKCIGGGYNFDYINAELIDVKNNETIVTVSGEGYSENCPPLSGTIYGDIVNAVAGFWSR